MPIFLYILVFEQSYESLFPRMKYLLACCFVDWVLAQDCLTTFRFFESALKDALYKTPEDVMQWEPYSLPPVFRTSGLEGPIELAPHPIASFSSVSVWFARGRSDGASYVVKHHQDSGRLSALHFDRNLDPLVGEYAFAKALRGTRLVPDILWISGRRPFDPTKDIQVMRIAVPPEFVSKLVNRNAQVRTIVEERVGQSVDEWITEAKNLLTPVNVLRKIVTVSRKILVLLKLLHAAGVAHGDIAFRNIVIETSAEGEQLAFIDLEKGHLLCGDPGDSDISQFVWKGGPIEFAIQNDVNMLGMEIQEAMEPIVAQMNPSSGIRLYFDKFFYWMGNVFYPLTETRVSYLILELVLITMESRLLLNGAAEIPNL